MSLLLLILQPQRSYMNALMAELVDALVSKTNEVTLVPVRFRLRVHSILISWLTISQVHKFEKLDVRICVRILKKDRCIPVFFAFHTTL